MSGSPQADIRGFLIPRIEQIMTMLSDTCPPQTYPVDNDGIARVETQADGASWIRGGTTPSGQKLADVAVANYFIGSRYLAADIGKPQRIVWVPPGPGAERFVQSDSAGFLRGQFSEGIQGRSFRHIRARAIPVGVDLWCNDWDDLDILVEKLAEAVWTIDAGQCELVGVDCLLSGGTVSEEMGHRGIRYKLAVQFVTPISLGMDAVTARNVLVDVTKNTPDYSDPDSDNDPGEDPGLAANTDD